MREGKIFGIKLSLQFYFLWLEILNTEFKLCVKILKILGISIS